MWMRAIIVDREILSVYIFQKLSEVYVCHISIFFLSITSVIVCIKMHECEIIV